MVNTYNNIPQFRMMKQEVIILLALILTKIHIASKQDTPIVNTGKALLVSMLFKPCTALISYVVIA